MYIHTHTNTHTYIYIYIYIYIRVVMSQNFFTGMSLIFVSFFQSEFKSLESTTQHYFKSSDSTQLKLNSI